MEHFQANACHGCGGWLDTARRCAYCDSTNLAPTPPPEDVNYGNITFTINGLGTNERIAFALERIADSLGALRALGIDVPEPEEPIAERCPP